MDANAEEARMTTNQVTELLFSSDYVVLQRHGLQRRGDAPYSQSASRKNFPRAVFFLKF